MKSLPTDINRPTDLGTQESDTSGPLLGDDSMVSDLELLSSALQDAMDAHRLGVVVGPGVDEVALARAWARARNRDAGRELDGAA